MDGADQLLLSERSHLLSLKKFLEAQLSRVQMQLQVLNKARARLSAAIQERSRVTDLLCQSMSSAASLPTPRFRSMRPSSGSSTSRSQISLPQHGRDKLPSSRSSMTLSLHAKSHSAPAPLYFVPNLIGAAGTSGQDNKGEMGSARGHSPPKSARMSTSGENPQSGMCHILHIAVIATAEVLSFHGVKFLWLTTAYVYINTEETIFFFIFTNH